MASTARGQVGLRGHHEGRLLPRYTLTTPVEVEWLTGRYRRGLLRREIVPTATVIDLSTGGMLVEAPGRPPVALGEVVELGSDGQALTARVVHKHPALDPDMQLLGLEFLEMTPVLRDTIFQLVRALRG